MDLGLGPRSCHLFGVALSWNIIEGEGEARPNRPLYLGFANKKFVHKMAYTASSQINMMFETGQFACLLLIVLLLNAML